MPPQMDRTEAVAEGSKLIPLSQKRPTPRPLQFSDHIGGTFLHLQAHIAKVCFQ